jgi:hypothetical protein
VGFDVGLIDEIQPIAVTQIIPAGIVRVMAGADGVDVELFHQLDIADHGFDRQGVSGVWIVFVAVDSFDQDRHSVKEKLTVLDLDLSEPRLARDDF